MPKLCIISGCPWLASAGCPRCPVHERQAQATRNRRPERSEYRDPGYRLARRRVLGQPCWRCGAPATTADHLKPVRDGGTWRDGLRPACRSCNSDWRTT